MDVSVPLETIGAEIAGRYRVEQLLGRGGNAAVYCVHDQRSGRRLALKRSWSRDARKLERCNLFLEREYHVLSQLAHPGIIEVYDYGMDERGAYYTMELLDGAELDAGKQLPWRRVCAVLRDVASSLAILHSRGLVHRDVSARNVRYTSDGRAKLIDFGAMVSMGVAKEAVGTPPFMAPEVMQVQALDARADLFSLGALGYYLLLGRHAFPARRLSDLRDVWRSRPHPPARLIAEIPSELSELVLQLLSLDRNARPVSAGEVMERLSALAELPLELGAEVSRAYLATPTLVGRERVLVSIRRQMLSLVRGDGATLLVRGVAGSGRSRLLDACALEGKLLGATIARSDASASADFCVARSLALQLLELLPDKAYEAARLSRGVLAHLLEPLREELWSATGPMPERSLLIRELRDFVLTLARTTRIVLVIDDADRIDEPSAALVAALAHKTDRHALLLAVALDNENHHAARGSLRIIDDIARTIEVLHLAAEDTEALMRSVFGDVANLSLCAGQIHGLSHGNPRAAMELAQHLVDRGLARYSAGSWSLPSELKRGDLPSSLSASLGARIARIGAEARELLDALALADDDALPPERYPALTSQSDAKHVFKLLDELISARILVADSQRYYFAQRGILIVVEETMPSAQRVALHSRIADVLASMAGDLVRRGHHLLGAGRDLEAIELLGSINLVQRLPPLVLLETLVERAERHALPARMLQELRIALLSKASVVMATAAFRRAAPVVLQQLQRDSGLLRYAELGALAQPERLVRAMADAQASYLATPERERVHEPLEAIRELARISGSATSMANPMYELELLESLPSLEPLLGLSPALGIVSLLLDASKEVVSGTGHRGILIYRQVIERLGQPDHGGLDEAQYQRTRLGVEYACGALEAGLGISIEQRAEVLESDRELRVNAWRIRVLMHLNQGNVDEARRCGRRAELLRLQEGLAERYAASTLAGELLGYALLGDLLGIKSMLDGVSALAASHPGWQPIRLYAQARYRQLQGDAQGGLSVILAALALVQPGRHAFYPYIAAVHISLLEHLGRFEEAAQQSRAYLTRVDRAGLHVTKQVVYVAAAQVLARVGDHDTALRLLSSAIAGSRELGRRGFALGRLYEARARVALYMRNREDFDAFVEVCALEYKEAHNPRLGARLALLVEYAREVFSEADRPLGAVALLDLPEDETEYDTLHSRMMECVDEFDRGRCALTLMLQSTESSEGYLFGVEDGSVQLLASLPEGSAREGIVTWIEDFVYAELKPGGTTTASANADDSTESIAGPRLRYMTKEGRHFEAVPLMTEAKSGRRMIAVLAIALGPGSLVLPPKQLCSDLAMSLREHGLSGILLE